MAGCGQQLRQRVGRRGSERAARRDSLLACRDVLLPSDLALMYFCNVQCDDGNVELSERARARSGFDFIGCCDYVIDDDC